MKITTTTHNKRNWKKYNNSLVKRGRIDIWIDKDLTSWWYANGKQTYRDQSIELMLTLKFVYHLPLRAVTGFIASLFTMNGIDVEIPDYSTLSRRAEKIPITLKKKQKEKVVLIIDATGLKVYGEGEWKVRKHGWSYRRTWKKLNVAIDTDGEVRALILSPSRDHDSIHVSSLLSQEEASITAFYGDGAYDSSSIYHMLEERNISHVFIPPRKNTDKTKEHHPLKQKNLHLSQEEWKKQTGYHKRSLVEAHMRRHKQILSQYLSFRKEESQKTEIMVKTNILNKMLDV